jgi:hypothetical protein
VLPEKEAKTLKAVERPNCIGIRTCLCRFPQYGQLFGDLTPNSLAHWTSCRERAYCDRLSWLVKNVLCSGAGGFIEAPVQGFIRPTLKRKEQDAMVAVKKFQP